MFYKKKLENLSTSIIKDYHYLRIIQCILDLDDDDLCFACIFSYVEALIHSNSLLPFIE